MVHSTTHCSAFRRRGYGPSTARRPLSLAIGRGRAIELSCGSQASFGRLTELGGNHCQAPGANLTVADGGWWYTIAPCEIESPRGIESRACRALVHPIKRDLSLRNAPVMMAKCRRVPDHSMKSSLDHARKKNIRKLHIIPHQAAPSRPRAQHRGSGIRVTDDLPLPGLVSAPQAACVCSARLLVSLGPFVLVAWRYTSLYRARP